MSRSRTSNRLHFKKILALLKTLECDDGGKLPPNPQYDVCRRPKRAPFLAASISVLKKKQYLPVVSRTGNREASPAPPPPMGAGMARRGEQLSETRISPEQKLPHRRGASRSFLKRTATAPYAPMLGGSGAGNAKKGVISRYVTVYPPVRMAYWPSGLVIRTFMVAGETVAGTVKVVEMVLGGVTIPSGAVYRYVVPS